MHNCAACGKWLKNIEFTNRRKRALVYGPKEMDSQFNCLPRTNYFEVVCEACSKLQRPMVVISQRCSDALMLDIVEALHVVTDLRGTEYTTFQRGNDVYAIRGMDVVYTSTKKDSHEAWRYFCFLNDAIRNSRGIKPQERA